MRSPCAVLREVIEKGCVFVKIEKKRRGFVRGVFCLLLTGLLALGGCGDGRPVVYTTENLPENDGKPAKLTIGPIDEEFLSRWTSHAGEMTGVLEEVIAKYQADFPNTEIQVISGADYEGDVDIEVIHQGIGIPGDQWLLDLSEYADAWEREGRLCKASDLIAHYMGGEGMYAIPMLYAQPVVIYREDWFQEYNADKTAWPDKVSVENWGRFMRISERLEKGGVLIAEDELPELFHSILWSTTGTGAMADPAAACFASEKAGGGTIYKGKKAESSMSLFREVLDRRVDVEDGNEVEAFVNGEAAVLILLSPTDEEYAKLDQMPEGSWKAVSMPAGESGVTVVPSRWTAWAVNAGTEEPEKAVHFLAYLTNPDNNTHMVKEKVASPVYKEVTALEPSLLEEPRGGEIDLVNQSCFYADVPNYMLQRQDWELLRENTVKYAQGSISGKEFLADLDEFYQEQLDECRKDGLPLWEETEDEKGEGTA